MEIQVIENSLIVDERRKLAMRVQAASLGAKYDSLVGVIRIVKLAYSHTVDCEQGFVIRSVC